MKCTKLCMICKYFVIQVKKFELIITGYILPLMSCDFSLLSKRYSPRIGKMYGSALHPLIKDNWSDCNPPQVMT